MKIDKRFLDIGEEDSQTGTNKVIETAERKLWHQDEETIYGPKSFDTPAHSPIEPVTASDFVPKAGLLNMIRCTGEPYWETLVITEEDLVNGYATLSKAVAPGQQASFKVLHFDGASALSLGLDFTIAEDDNGDLARFRWTGGYTLGKPGRMVAGQEITVRYNYCVPVVPMLDEPLSGFWMLDDYGPVSGGTNSTNDVVLHGSYNMVPIPASASEQTVTFRNILSDDIKTLQLPTLNAVPEGNPGYFLSVFRGMPLLITLPTPGSGYAGTMIMNAPFLAGKTTIYASDWSVWGKVLEVDPPAILTDDPSPSYLEIYGGYNRPRIGVSVLGDEYLAVFATHPKINGTGALIVNTTIIARLYDRSFDYVRTVTLSVNGG
jgi:hypothetical protein